jgi:hypothetical protein
LTPEHSGFARPHDCTMVMRARFHFEMQCIIAMKRIPLTLQEIDSIQHAAFSPFRSQYGCCIPCFLGI